MKTAFHAAAPCPVEVLNSFCRENLSTIKCPRSYDFMDELPRLDNGKLYKRRLQNAYKKKASN